MYINDTGVIENNYLETANRQIQVRYIATQSNKRLKQGIWLYLILLIFEGALRKWVLPSLATPLLIIRDPIALWLLITASQKGLLPKTSYIFWMILIGFASIFTALLFGHGSLPVAIFGARILIIHFPLMFVIGRIFDRNDVIEAGKIILWISIPMVVLITLQFYSPQSAWVNRGIGGDMAGSGFNGGASGYYRPSGTFSFTSGLTQFFCLAACFVLYFWINSSGINRFLLIGATAALVAAIPLSISRSLLFQVGISVIFLMIGIARKPKYLGRIISAGIGAVMVLMILSKVSLFETATDAFTNRFETASEAEGGLDGVLIDRYLGGLVGSLSGTTNAPFFGLGSGLGTNVGSQLLTGKQAFLISEGEWGRIVGELGTLMGLTVILLRVVFTAKVFLASYRRLAIGDLLPWILISFGLLTIPQAQWAQPTGLGFSTLIGGLMLASLHINNKKQTLKNVS